MHGKRGYERQEEARIPTVPGKCGYMKYNNRKESNMFANYWEIRNRVKYIQEELRRIEGVEKGMPAGELIVAKNNKNYKWYFHNQNTTIYLPKKEIELARKLTLKNITSCVRKNCKESCGHVRCICRRQIVRKICWEKCWTMRNTNDCWEDVDILLKKSWRVG